MNAEHLERFFKRSLCWMFLTLVVPPCLCQTPARFPFLDTTLPVEQRAADLVHRLTLEEKVDQMMDQAPAIPRLGIPAYGWWNEGLHGVARSGYATLFPQAIGMAATWDTPLLANIGSVISTEARAKYNHALTENNHDRYYGLTFWSPNINIFRDPRWGRGQETYGEDPYLTSRLGVAFVEGLQGSDPTYYKVIATPKHYAVHSGPESERHRFNVVPSPHDLEDTYLPAFRATMTEAHADSIMCAYNAIDGTPACANKTLLQDRLRGDWAFKGFVTSDCGAIDDFFERHKTSPDAEHAAALAVLAGTDTNCGNTYKVLTQAVQHNLLPESAIDAAVSRLFTARIKLGIFDSPAGNPYALIPFTENDATSHHALALTAANESIVLLKNENRSLPLKAGLRTIAVVGPNAASLASIEGNYNAIPSHPVLPLDGIKSEFRNARVLYAQGAPYAEGLALPAPRTLFHPAPGSGEQGLAAEYYQSSDLSGTPLLTRLDPQLDFDWNQASPVPGLKADSYSVRWRGTITPPTPGDYLFRLKLSHCGDCQDVEQVALYLDEAPVELSAQSTSPACTLHLANTKPHSIRVEYRHRSTTLAGGLTLLWQPPTPALKAEAVKAAQQADVVVAFVGLSPDLEGEEMPVHIAGFSGGDRTDISLPSAQREMLEAVGATGKPLVLVLMNGSALALQWAQQHASAVLEAWYPGEAAGTAIAQTLAGKNNPGGKLPLTFYSGVQELPPFDDYSMHNRTYRYYAGKPTYSFGYGLSYTRFVFSNIRLSTQRVQAGQSLTAECDVRNTGDLAGDEVAELYLTAPRTAVSPRIALAGFQRLHLAPGQSRHISFGLSPRQLSVVDDQGRRTMSAGSYLLSIGGGQPQDAPSVTSTFAIEGTQELPR